MGFSQVAVDGLQQRLLSGTDASAVTETSSVPNSAPLGVAAGQSLGWSLYAAAPRPLIEVALRREDCACRNAAGVGPTS